jgi:hypothetical protein
MPHAPETLQQICCLLPHLLANPTPSIQMHTAFILRTPGIFWTVVDSSTLRYWSCSLSLFELEMIRG